MKYLLCVLFALLLALPLLAQDETVTPVATQEASPGVNIEVNPPATDPLPEGNVSIPGWSIVVVVVLAIAGGASLPSIIDRIRGDESAIAEIEVRANQLPPEILNAFVRVSEVVESGARLVREAADRIPAKEKPAEITLIPSEVLRNELIRRGEL